MAQGVNLTRVGSLQPCQGRELLMACRSGCKTQDHASYAECLRSARAGVSFGGTIRQKTESELDAYRRARAAGIQPAGTTQAAVDAANAMSDKYGQAYDATSGTVGGKAPGIAALGG